MWQDPAEGLLPAHDQPQPSEAAVDQLAATPIDNLARAGVRAYAGYEADPDADDVVVCPPTRDLLALPEVREVWKARRSADSNSLIPKQRAYYIITSMAVKPWPWRAKATEKRKKLDDNTAKAAEKESKRRRLDAESINQGGELLADIPRGARRLCPGRR
eukprot:jgi/Tetstr1/429629/TSEL_019527.t1